MIDSDPILPAFYTQTHTLTYIHPIDLWTDQKTKIAFTHQTKNQYHFQKGKTYKLIIPT